MANAGRLKNLGESPEREPGAAHLAGSEGAVSTPVSFAISPLTGASICSRRCPSVKVDHVARLASWNPSSRPTSETEFDREVGDVQPGPNLGKIVIDEHLPSLADAVLSLSNGEDFVVASIQHMLAKDGRPLFALLSLDTKR
jgi:hypothetical protein